MTKLFQFFPKIKLRWGFEGVVLVIQLPGSNSIAVKLYRKTTVIKWLNSVLSKNLIVPKGVWPVAHREKTLLERLSVFGICPRPIYARGRVLVMEYAGEALYKFREKNMTSLQVQADNIFHVLEECQVNHNDIKLGNLIVDAVGTLRLIDFTLADDRDLAVSSLDPDPAWGRFLADKALLNLSKLE
jgi:RIO-like serine/threonine protein kinase